MSASDALEPLNDEASARSPWRRRIAVVALALAAVTTWDLSRPPAEQLSAKALLAGIGFYQRALSPLGSRLGVSCRFEPTCSHYGEAVIRRHGAARGSWLAIWRVARCNPLTPMGTVEPPPGLAAGTSPGSGQ